MNFFQKISKNQTFFIAEIGINHNGNIDTALKLIQSAKLAGCDAVKFQKRTPEIATPKSSWDVVRDTPWGKMKYIEYKKKIEFGKKEYDLINKFCKKNDILWTASCWDAPSVKFIEKYKVKFHKVIMFKKSRKVIENRTMIACHYIYYVPRFFLLLIM